MERRQQAASMLPSVSTVVRASPSQGQACGEADGVRHATRLDYQDVYRGKRYVTEEDASTDTVTGTGTGTGTGGRDSKYTVEGDDSDDEATADRQDLAARAFYGYYCRSFPPTLWADPIFAPRRLSSLREGCVALATR